MTHYAEIDVGRLARVLLHEKWAFAAILWAGPASGNVDPLGQAATVLALDVDNIRVTAAAAAHAVLLRRVICIPVLVLFDSLTLVEGRLL